VKTDKDSSVDMENPQLVRGKDPASEKTE